MIGVTAPDEARADFPMPPYGFAEASGEALGVLNEQ